MSAALPRSRHRGADVSAALPGSRAAEVARHRGAAAGIEADEPRGPRGERGRRTCPPRCLGRASPRGSRPTNMSATLPRSRSPRGLDHRGSRRTCPPRCRLTAGPRMWRATAGRGADEHVRRTAEVARHRGAVGPTNMSAALPSSHAAARPWGRRTCPPRCRGARRPRRGRRRGCIRRLGRGSRGDRHP